MTRGYHIIAPITNQNGNNIVPTFRGHLEMRMEMFFYMTFLFAYYSTRLAPRSPAFDQFVPLTAPTPEFHSTHMQTKKRHIIANVWLTEHRHRVVQPY